MHVDRWFLRLAEGSVRRPRRAIVVLLLLVAAAAPGLGRLELRTDGHALVPPHDPVVLFDQEVREHFGLRDPVIVLVESSHENGIYNTETLRTVAQLSTILAELPEVGQRNITSLATERRDRVFPGTLDFRTFLEPAPDTPELLEQVHQDVEAAGILTGTLVSADGTATAILVGVPSVTSQASGAFADRSDLLRRIAAAVAPFESSNDTVLVAGAPLAEALLGQHILEDLAVLVPLAMLVIATILWLGCRRLWGVVLGLTEVGACLVWTFGIMGWVGAPVYLTTAVLPVILTTIGLADEIHIFWHYQRLPRANDHPAAVSQTMREMTRPVVLTSLTTAIAFLSFLASPIAPVSSLGAFAALGILFCLLFSLTVVPAVLTLVPPESMLRARRGAAADSERWWTSHVLALVRRRRAALMVMLVVTVALGLGMTRVEVQDSWIDGFAPSSAFRRATDRVNRLLFGTHVLHAHLVFDVPEGRFPAARNRAGPLLDPKVLGAIGDFEDFLRSRPEVGGVLGAHSHMTTVNYLWLARRQGARSLPRDPNRVAMALDRFEMARGLHRRREVIDDDLRRALVSIFLGNANFRETASLMAAIRGYQHEHLDAIHASVAFAGDVAVSQAMIPAIVSTQVRSLALALVGAWLIVWLLSGSLRAAACAVLPAVLAVVWVFGAMGWLSVPLGVATSMFCAITLGIGVDHGIHFYERYRRARDQGREGAAAAAIEEAGPAIVADTLAIALGFGLLAVSQVPANARLGLLVASALVASCTLTIVGLGALLTRSPVRTEEPAST